MKNLLIVIFSAVVAAVATVVMAKVLGYEAPAWLGGAVGGAVSGVVAVKFAQGSPSK